METGTDITTLVAVESVLRSDTEKDPWGPRCAGTLADLFVYSDRLRYILPIPPKIDPNDYPGRPNLLLRLVDAAPDVVRPERYFTAEPPMLQTEQLLPTFDYFCLWARNNRTSLHKWSRLHESEWVREGHVSRVERDFVFPVDLLLSDRDVEGTAASHDLAPKRLLYAFDVVLRYPLYGSLIGKAAYFASHPIRDAFPLLSNEPGPVPPVCISFAKSVEALAPHLTVESYVELLLDLRTAVRSQGIHQLQPHEIDRETIRDIAGRVSLPPRLKHYSKAFGVTGGIIGGLGALPLLGSAAAIGGAAVVIASAMWKGGLPRVAARWKWLRWGMTWDVEDEAEQRET